MRTLSGEQFAAYARTQIETAEQILAGHRPAGAACSCARQRPCPVAASCTRSRDHYRAKLALAEATVQLSIVRPATVRRLSAWRRLAQAVLRGEHR